MSIMELSVESLEQVGGGYVFCPDDRNHPMQWEVISDINGSVVEKVNGWREDAQARAEQLGYSQKEIGWAKVNSLRAYGPLVAIGG